MCASLATEVPTECPDGQYQPSTGQISCLQCSEGYQCANKSIAETMCDPGYYSAAGSMSCTPCTNGKAIVFLLTVLRTKRLGGSQSEILISNVIYAMQGCFQFT